MSDDVYDPRAIVRRGLVLGIDDTGPVQTATVQTSDGDIYSGIEVYQAAGDAGVAPVDGAIVILLAIGGDPANLVALISNPSSRLGKMGFGDKGIYAADGTRVVAQASGTVAAIAGLTINLIAPNITLQATGAVVIDGPGGITLNGSTTVNGPLQVDGNIHATGTIT
jgi:phage baseplate assembly protein V